MYQVVEWQREVYGHFADQIKPFAAGGGWALLVGMLPLGVLFGAGHALTPGHSKAVLATYVAGSPISSLRALGVSLTLSFTHVTIAVLIAVLSLPLVSLALGSVGRAPALEAFSRGLLGAIGAWMLWRAICGHKHHRHEGEAVGFIAGFIPCPLTLFVMTFAISRGVPEAGLVFPGAMMLGVATTLSAVALVTALCRDWVAALMRSRPELLNGTSRVIDGIAGVVLLLIALREVFRA